MSGDVEHFSAERSVFPLLVVGALIGGIASCRSDSSPEHGRSEASTVRVGDAVVFSTYLGGSAGDTVRDVASDRDGNLYVTGGTSSVDFPTTGGAYQTTRNPGPPDARAIDPLDVFVMKFDRAGRMLWSTFVGGPNNDRAYAIEVDQLGYVYIAGRAGRGFPVTPAAFQSTFMGGQEAAFYGPQDGFVCKLQPDGSAVVFCSYFGGSDAQIIRDLAVDEHGDIYVASAASAGDYPPPVREAFRNGWRPSIAGKLDNVVAKISSDGSRVLWATYIGGSGAEWGQPSLRVDGSGQAHLLTVTESTDVPTTTAYSRANAGGTDFYVAKLLPDGSGPAYATYLGGSAMEHIETHELALDADGNAYVASGTTSADFPTTAGAFQRTYGGSGGRGTGSKSNYTGDVIVAKISSDGSQLLASTFIGGSWGEAAEGVAVDAAGNVYLTGGTFSDNFPMTPTAIQARRKGPLDAFVVQLSADFTRLLYATYLGGSGSDVCRCGALRADGAFCVGAETPSTDWPTRNAIQSRFQGGSSDGALIVFALPAP